MSRDLRLFLIATVGLLLLNGCGPKAVTPTVTPTASTAEPTSAATSLPATATAVPPTVTPTAAPATGTVTPPAAPTETFTPTATPTAPPSAVPPTDTPSPTRMADGAGNADVLYVRAVQASNESWTFHVTVEHPDTGWEDYADGWDVVAPDGEVLKPDPSSPFTRLLLHPHENEQPFTRSQSGIVVPEGVTKVRVRAHDMVDGFGGREVVVDLTIDSGPDFEVER